MKKYLFGLGARFAKSLKNSDPRGSRTLVTGVRGRRT